VILIDSPVANTANIARALRAAGASVDLSRDPAAIARASKLVLPGVGSFAAAMQWLRATRLDAAITEAVANGAYLLGICVGHQLLFDVSYELGTTRGLGLVRGEVRKFAGTLPVPQIGWNRIQSGGEAILPVPSSSGDERTGTGEIACPSLLAGVESEAFYFVNSYAARDAENEIATAEYDGPFTAAVQRERVFGVQFHPEKSSTAGLRVLRNFVACN
jgi:glutamine amidotransferase